MMDFLWLAAQAWSAVRYYWPVTATILVVLVSLLFVSRRALLQSTRQTRLLVLSPLLVPPSILLWGSLMRHPDAYTAAPRWPSHVLIALLLVAVLFFAFVIWRAIGLRWLALAFVLLAAWLGLCAAFVATMSLSNDWL